jgi:hypothetical protein
MNADSALSCFSSVFIRVHRRPNYSSQKTAKTHKNWWTGKDSNLRNSQGVTDLQSVGFNHSPTCPGLSYVPVGAHFRTGQWA